MWELTKLAVPIRLVQVKTCLHVHPIWLLSNSYSLFFLDELLFVDLPLYLLSEFVRHLLNQCLQNASVNVFHKGILLELILVFTVAFLVCCLEDDLWDEILNHIFTDDLCLILCNRFFEGQLCYNSDLSRHELLRK